MTTKASRTQATSAGLPARLRFTDFAKLLGVKLTKPQEVLCAVCFDGVEPGELQGEARALAQQLFGDVERVAALARAVLCWVVGARSGKTWIAGLFSLWKALTGDVSGLAPGEVATCLFAAPDLRLARLGVRYAKGAAKLLPALAELIGEETKDGFTLTRGDAKVRIEALPSAAAGSSHRGRSLLSVVLDELAFFRGENNTVNDTDVYKAAAPRVVAGGQLLMCSTPWTQSGLLWQTHQDNFGAPKTALVAEGATWLMRRGDRHIEEMIERERARDSDNCAREFGARFELAGAGQFFDRESLQAALSSELAIETTRAGALDVALGADLAVVRDASAFVALHRLADGWTVAEAIVMKPRRGAPLSLERVVATLRATAERHGVGQARADHHMLSEARRHAGSLALLPVPGGAAGKLNMHVACRDAIRTGKLRIPAKLAWLAEQLAAIVSHPLPGGGTALRSPRRAGDHGDAGSALVAACWTAFGGAATTIEDWDPVIRSARGSERGDIAPVDSDSRVGSREGYQIGGMTYAVDQFDMQVRPRPASDPWPLM